MDIQMSKINYDNHYQLFGLNKKVRYTKRKLPCQKVSFIKMDVVCYVKSTILLR